MAKTAADRIEVGGRDIAVSHPDKQLYPDDGYTKGDVIDYYRSVADVMVPHLRNRPLTLRRFPDGVHAGGFFQKEASNYFPEWLRVEAIPQRGSSRPVHHVVCDDPAGLVYLATQACLEFHVALSTIDDLEHPVAVVLDLDPPGGVASRDLRSVVRGICDRLRDAGLRPHVQATGGSGFHVLAALKRKSPFDDVRAFARQLAESAATDEPDWLTTEQRKDKRGDRIFLDTNRNAYGQTMIAPYSLRARTGAPAATPLDARELGKATPGGFGLANMSRRLAKKSDPWRDLGR